jgi:AraC family transcriptional regulator
VQVLRQGLVAVPVTTAIVDLTAPARSEHTILVNVGRPFRLVETLDGRPTTTRGAPGDVGVVPAGAELHIRSADGVPQQVSSLAFLLAPELLDEVFDAAGLHAAPLVPVVGSRSPQVAQIAGLVRPALPEPAGLAALRLETLGYALAVAVASDHSGLRTTPEAPVAQLSSAQLNRVVHHVEDNLAAPLALADLAALAHVSPFHFARLFRASTGRSPHAYVVERRVARAQELLTRTGLPIVEVAAACGFADQSHLTRQVVRHLGRTPSALRRGA